MSFIFPKQSQDLDPSYKTDLDFLVLFGMEKKLRLITEEIRYPQFNHSYLSLPLSDRSDLVQGLIRKHTYYHKQNLCSQYALHNKCMLVILEACLIVLLQRYTG